MSSRPSRARVLTAFAAVYLVWGSTYLAIRYAIETTPPLLMAGVRFMIAGALLYAWMRLREGVARPTRSEWAWAGFVGVLMLGGGNGAVVWSEQRVASGVAALIVATVALWVVVLEWARPNGRRPALVVIAGVLLGLAGVAVLVGPQQLGTGGGVDPLAAAVLVVASLSWAVGSLLSRSPRMPRPTLLGAAMQMLVGGAALTIAGLAIGEQRGFDVTAISRTSIIAFVYLILFGSLIGYTAFIWLVANVAPAKAATYAYVNPIVAVLLGWAIAGEPLSPRVLIAASVIVGAVALVTAGPRRTASNASR